VTNLAIPTVHLNGTSRQELIDQLYVAVRALHEAGSALARAAPNARDYYVQNPLAFSLAQDQHYARMQKLRDITRELEQIAEAL
jgi:hypothetical protein